MLVFLIIKKVKFKMNIFVKKIIWKLEYNNQIKLGNNVNFRQGMLINISKNGYVKIGNNTFFNNYCSINSHGRIEIGDNCLFGEGVKFYDHNHIFNTKKKIMDEPYRIGKIVIGNNCWIGSNVVILKGSIIGNNCTISAGCIISENVPDNSLVKRDVSTQIMDKIIRNE